MKDDNHTRPMAQALAMIAALRAAMPAGAGLEIGLLPHVGTERQGALQCLPLPPDADPAPLLRQARGAQMRVQAQVLIRPAPDDRHPWLFLDDLAEPQALALAARRACIVVRTSPGNCQIRMLADQPLTQQERRTCQDALVRSIGGDDNSRSGDKWGRLAGFTNRKTDPGKTGHWTELLADTSTTTARARSAVLLAAAAPHDAAATPATALPLSPRPMRAGGSPLPCSGPGLDPDPARGWSDRWAASLKFACASLRRNRHSDDEIIEQMSSWLLAQGKRKSESACRDLAIHLFRQAAAMQPRGQSRPS